MKSLLCLMLAVALMCSGCMNAQAENPTVMVDPQYVEEMYRIDNVLAEPTNKRQEEIRNLATSGELKYAESFIRLARGVFRPPSSLLPRHRVVETCAALGEGFLKLPPKEITADNVDKFLAELWPGHRTRVTVILIESGRLPQDVHDRVMYYYNEELDQSD